MPPLLLLGAVLDTGGLGGGVGPGVAMACWRMCFSREISAVRKVISSWRLSMACIMIGEALAHTSCKVLCSMCDIIMLSTPISQFVLRIVRWMTPRNMLVSLEKRSSHNEFAEAARLAA